MKEKHVVFGELIERGSERGTLAKPHVMRLRVFGNAYCFCIPITVSPPLHDPTQAAGMGSPSLHLTPQGTPGAAHTPHSLGNFREFSLSRRIEHSSFACDTPTPPSPSLVFMTHYLVAVEKILLFNLRARAGQLTLPWLCAWKPVRLLESRGLGVSLVKRSGFPGPRPPSPWGPCMSKVGGPDPESWEPGGE